MGALVGFRSVADAGLVSALPVWLSARPKRKSDRRPDEARRDLVVRGSSTTASVAGDFCIGPTASHESAST